MSDRDALRAVVRQLHAMLAHQKEMGVHALVSAPAPDREAWQARVASRERAKLARITAALQQDSDPPSRSAPALPEALAPHRDQDVPAPPSLQSQTQRPTRTPEMTSGSAGGEHGALWKQLGSRPTRLLAKPSASAPPRAPEQRRAAAPTPSPEPEPEPPKEQSSSPAFEEVSRRRTTSQPPHHQTLELSVPRDVRARAPRRVRRLAL